MVVTPERELLDQEADSIVVPMYDGELGVLPGRAPLIGRLGAGELRISQAGQTERYYVDGGFVQIRANVVTVLTQQAARPREIDAAAAERLLASSPPLTHNDAEAESVFRDRQRARARVRVTQGPAQQSAH